eukprot:314545-Lingulodinium_polyedra.AAC.1
MAAIDGESLAQGCPRGPGRMETPLAEGAGGCWPSPSCCRPMAHGRREVPKRRGTRSPRASAPTPPRP